MYDYDELAYEQDCIKAAMRDIDNALEEIEKVDGVESIRELLNDAKNDLASKLPEIDQHMYEAKRVEERAQAREYFDSIFAETRQSAYYKEYVEV